MDVRVFCGSITGVDSDALIVNLFEGVGSPGGATGAVDAALGGAISELIASGEISGKLAEVALLHTFGRIAPRRVLVVGLGKRTSFDQAAVRKVSGVAARALRKKGVRSVTSIVHGAGIGGLSPLDAARSVVEGTLLALYQGDLYKTSDENPGGIETFTIVELDEDKVEAFETGARQGQILAGATNEARVLADEPANKMTPVLLAMRAREVAERFGLGYEELDEKRMADLGMNALLSVAKGSEQPPRLIVLRHEAGTDRPTVAFVGKGLTFDSGGISIKPHEGLHMMKYDMCGGASVIGAMSAVAQLKPNINVLGLVPASENMPSGTAYRPGDVVETMDGKTVEIITTDAEGRMILADAITYALRQGVNYLVDVATLTGACAVALGPGYTGVMTNNPGLLTVLKDAAQLAGERVWELPLPGEYMENLRSSIADFKNVGPRYGGAIYGGLFIKEFVGDIPWVHMDIAGTAYSSRDEGSISDGYMASGATGVGVRTLAMLAARLAEIG